MIRKDYRSDPKLQANGEESRALLGFGVILALGLHGGRGSSHMEAVLELMTDLPNYNLMTRVSSPRRPQVYQPGSPGNR